MVDDMAEDQGTTTNTATATATPSPNTTPAHVDVSSSNEASAKRRKVRKGTRSCWECKRRKIRCIFASTEDVTCIGCQRRRAPCVTQEMPEDLAPAKKGNRHLSDRIAKVEDFMKEYLASKHVGVTDDAEVRLRQDGHPSSDVLPDRPSYLTPSSDQASHKTAEVPSSSGFTPGPEEDSSHDEIKTARDSLWAAFPPEEDSEILLGESSISSVYTELVNTQSHGKLTRESLSRPYSTAELPGPNSHPVILAKHMLMFAITLQSPAGKGIVGLSQPQSVLERRLVTAATRWVTTNGEMHGTVDCLICIILEGVFEVNSGNLRRAWAAYRRAMTVAQLMGLHRSPVPPLKRISPEVDADPEFLWFRIVYMDRYLSLLLGLPQGTSDTRIGAAWVQQPEPHLDKFERSITVIASRILDRNESSFATSELTTTQSIDSELLQASKSMPASFWRAADFHNLTPGSPDTLLETIRLSAQVYYYGLSIQLHLPYTMASDGNTAHEYSKITCVNASREIMKRFIAHRTFNPTSSCSRPVDFWALLAGMTLVLAHLDAHHHRDVTNSLAHQRFSDRAMLDHALERMDVISDSNHDPISQKSAKLLRRLLDVEADAAEGTSFTARSVRGDVDAQEDKDDGPELRLHIPYLGVIKIARQGPICREHPQRHPVAAPDSTIMFPPHVSPTDQQPPSYIDTTNHASGYEQSALECPNQDDIGLRSQDGLPPTTAGVDDWTFQGVDMAFFDSLMRGTPSIDAAALEQQWIEDPPTIYSDP
ncbi:hypothetical protein CONLIGDRAFT_215274 [Coniochaeta ligniaria NRRL 30616]|uniref:Zn(2)-C6 fungal-type domain-containing protein n=1 Tax=Coniochaeta ligniaria NRRL 30616 TaxID=1408157 RepID=A0A1J7IYA2_9PEZI|nr:hypothetical protein CONLIGDRAFT_215274 [Coniochaeta ligniaria NRRL 30616]